MTTATLGLLGLWPRLGRNIGNAFSMVSGMKSAAGLISSMLVFLIIITSEKIPSELNVVQNS